MKVQRLSFSGKTCRSSVSPFRDLRSVLLADTTSHLFSLLEENSRPSLFSCQKLKQGKTSVHQKCQKTNVSPIQFAYSIFQKVCLNLMINSFSSHRNAKIDNVILPRLQVTPQLTEALNVTKYFSKEAQNISQEMHKIFHRLGKCIFLTSSSNPSQKENVKGEITNKSYSL